MPDAPGAEVLYLGRADVEALGIGPDAMRAAVADAFRARAAGRARTKPKLALDLQPGHLFQAMCALDQDLGLAAVKWLGMAPAGSGGEAGGGSGLHALIALNDLPSGRLLAIMDGDWITGARTAAMSAVAAASLARRDARSVGFVGCGLQARTHLEALAALLPGLSNVLLLGRGRAGAERLAADARAAGLDATLCTGPDELLDGSDVVVSTVPADAGLSPFLDARRLRPGSFVAAVDVARSWIPDGLRALDVVATDDHEGQAAHPPLSAAFGPAGSFDADLSDLASGVHPGRTATGQRAMFAFRGSALADLAAASLVFRIAVRHGAGRILPR